ncbi:BspA family leucine-rich repeat surface protein [Enterococcus faecalis]|uniref:BspA family leucine-rich repeat surface protein n=2 Tax=Enterococcus faecalis TaxID=1351 RepID=UPI00313AE435
MLRKTMSIITVISLFSTMLLPITVMAEEAKSEELNKKETTVLPENKIDMEISDEKLKNNEQIPSGEINITDNSDGISKTEVTEQEQEENNIVKTSPEKTEISTLDSSTYANSDGWEYTDKGTYCVITGYSGNEQELIVPNEINGKPTKITNKTFNSYFLGGAQPESIKILSGRLGKVGVEGTSLEYAINGIKSLKNLDLSGLDTSNVTNMSGMLQGNSLTNLNLSGLDTSNVTRMDMMLRGNKFSSIDVSNLNTSNVTNMYSMFSSNPLISIDLSNFDTRNVTNLGDMFYNCPNLTNLDLSNFDTSNVTNIAFMFKGCSSLTNVNLSSFNTSKVISLRSLFEGCSNLSNLDLSNFDTSNVIRLDNMFAGCLKLTKLDLRNFNLKNLDFNNTTGLKAVFNTAVDTPLTIIATDPFFFNYQYDKDKRTMSQILFNANGGIYVNGKTQLNYFTSCAIRPEETSLEKLEEFKQNNLPTKTDFLFNGYTTTTDTSQATSVLDLIGTVYDAQWKKTISLEVPATISFGTHKLSKGTNYYSVDTVEGTDLSVTDNRGIGSKWQLTAKLQTPFTNNGKTLSNSLVYKTSIGEETITENAAQVIATHTTSTDSEKTVVSDNWTNTQGLMLKLEEGKAYAGEYSGTIEWTLNDTP